MRIAILSDIHSNIKALEAVYKELTLANIKDIILVGDIFGYYPWASDTYRLLGTKNIIAVIKGNHDEFILNNTKSHNQQLELYSLALHNKMELEENEPEAIRWLSGLKSSHSFIFHSYKITLCHGTPDNILDGRFYPDDKKIYKWFPKKNEILLLGHTHYPLFRETKNGGVIFNPGSIGQPRDGKTSASWGIWEVGTNSWSIRRTDYNYKKVMVLLQKLNWNKRAIRALSKTYLGDLKF